MINLFLLLLIIILIIPQSLSQTVRKAWPFFACLLAVFLLTFTTQKLAEADLNQLQVKALNEKHEDSGGAEIWLEKVLVNGEAFKPGDFFDDGWIRDGNSLVWRPYKQKEGMSKVISAPIQPGTEVELLFQTNQWRGKAEVIYGGNRQTVDCYSATAVFDQTVSVKIVMPELVESKYTITAKEVVLIILMALVFLNGIYMFLYYLKKRSFSKQKNISDGCEIWIDALKVLAVGMIVLIHSSGALYNDAFSEHSTLWLKGLWINAIPRFAVPCFLMISGALVLPKKYDFDKALLNRVSRILVPLIFWSTCYILLRKLLWNSGDNIFIEVLKIPFENQDNSLWYGYQLVWLYLGMPFWQTLYRYLTKRKRWLFVLFSLGIPGVLTMLGELSLLGVPEYLPFGSINAMVCYVGMLFLGCLLYDIINESEKRLVLLSGVGLTAAGLGIMIVSSIYLSNEMGRSMHTFFSEVRIPGILYGSGIFLLAGSLKGWLYKWPNMLKSAVDSLSRISLGVYMTHNLILGIFPSITIGGREISRNYGSVKQLLACVVIYYGITTAGCFLISKLPGLKRLVL